MNEKIAIISVVANFILAAVKIGVGLLINSTAVLAEGYHSLTDIISSFIGWVGIRYSKKPSDAKHPYGYYKYEVLAGAIITLVLLIAGIDIIYEAYKSLILSEDVSFFPPIAYYVIAGSAIVNEVMARFKIYYGKKENSFALISDGYHSRVDVYTSLGVFAGLILSRYWSYADPLIAMLIGLYVIKEAYLLGKEAIESLLDISAGEAVEKEIRDIVAGFNVKPVNIKTLKKGAVITANIEIALSKDESVAGAEALTAQIKNKLIEKIESLKYVAIQVKSYDIQSSIYKPLIGRGFGWINRGRYRGEVDQAVGMGPDGMCVCPKCGHRTTHERGFPCSTIKCPKCNTEMARK